MWFLIPAAVVLGKLAYDYFTDDDSPAATSDSHEQQKRNEYQQMQKKERAAEIGKKLCAYATSGVNNIIDRNVSLSLKGADVSMGKIITFIRAETDTADKAMAAMSSLSGSRMKLNRRREKLQVNALEDKLDEIAGMVKFLEQERAKIDDIQ